MQTIFYVMFFVYTINVVQAASVSVYPTKLIVSKEDPIAVLEVKNTGNSTTTIQLQALRWQQNKQEDLYNDTVDLLVTPLLFTMQPQQTQIVRVAPLNQSFSKEQAYRLILHEVPSEQKTEMQFQKSLLTIMLKISLPLFIVPSDKPNLDMNWTGAWTKDNKLRLSARNTGNRTILVNQFQLINGDRDPLIPEQKVFNYILPDQLHYWDIELKETKIPLYILVKNYHALSKFAIQKTN